MEKSPKSNNFGFAVAQQSRKFREVAHVSATATVDQPLTRQPSVVCTVNECSGEIASPEGRLKALFSHSRTWSRASGHRQVLTRNLTFGASSNQAAGQLTVVTANNVPIAGVPA